MARYSYSNFMPASNVGELDYFNAKFKDLRWRIPSSGIVLITAENEGNLPGLAFTHLGETGLWWSLAYFNGIQDPYNDVKVGMLLRIPDKESLLALLQRQDEAVQDSVRI